MHNWHEEEDEDDEGGVQFIKAAHDGNVNELLRLIRTGEGGVNFCKDWCSYYGKPALLVAITKDYQDCIDALLGCESLDLDTCSGDQDKGCIDALMQCIVCGNSLAFEKLIRKRASVHNRDNRGSTALYWAAAENRPEYAAKLLALGADVNSKNQDDETALFIAKLHGHNEVAAILLEAGAIDEYTDGDYVRMRELYSLP